MGHLAIGNFANAQIQGGPVTRARVDGIATLQHFACNVGPEAKVLPGEEGKAITQLLWHRKCDPEDVWQGMFNGLDFKFSVVVHAGGILRGVKGEYDRFRVRFGYGIALDVEIIVDKALVC